MGAHRIAAAAGPVLAMIALAAACSSSEVLSSTDGGGGTSGAGTSGLVVREDANEEPLPKRRGAFASRLTDHPEQREPCKVDGPFLDIGTLDPPAPVEDDTVVDGLKAHVFCTVASVLGTDSYEISASIDFDAANSRSMNVQGRITTSGEGSGVLFSMGKGKDTYAANSCRFRFGKAVHGVAAGRVWAEVACSEIETVAFDQLCSSVAEIRFENCRLK